MVPAAGVPDRVAVPLPLSAKVTPLGKGPDSESAAVGLPEVVTVKEPEWPSVNVALLPEVMAGADVAARWWLSTAAWAACTGALPLPLLLLVG